MKNTTGFEQFPSRPTVSFAYKVQAVINYVIVILFTFLRKLILVKLPLIESYFFNTLLKYEAILDFSSSAIKNIVLI